MAWAAVAGLLLFLSACAARAGGATSSPPPAQPDRLVLQIRTDGGFMSVGATSVNLPLVSIYADGRVITEGPVDARYPGPALPNLQVQRISPDDVRRLVDRAMSAGVGASGDLGRTQVMDAQTTRFTVVDGGHTFVRDVYALWEAARGGGVGPAGLGPLQQAARQKLLDLYHSLTDLEGTLGTGSISDAGAYTADAVAVVVRTATPRPDDPPQPEQPWPGPALPGQPFAGQAGLTCVSASGEAATTLLRAAAHANALTPWTTPDGSRWWATFRPLLPHESGCADVAG